MILAKTGHDSRDHILSRSMSVERFSRSRCRRMPTYVIPRCIPECPLSPGRSSNPTSAPRAGTRGGRFPVFGGEDLTADPRDPRSVTFMEATMNP
ncbi:hypothetical protein ACIBLA_21345 [Streptomyces sp. NPDC050433]|uniref:hypothetical protein n=1 Tax=Streptomyces sp. NPDC050433 TaxID=3365615 RepID=UPI00379E28E6